MHKIQSTNILRTSIFVCCLALIIFNSGYTLAVGNTRLSFGSLSILTICLLALVTVKEKKVRFITPSQVIVFLLISAVVVAFVVNKDIKSALEYIRYIMFILSGYLVAQLITFKQFVFFFSRTMRYVSIFAVGLFFFSELGLLDILPIYTTSFGSQYYNAGIWFLQIASNIRNSGIFWEPGLYAAFLALALAIEVIFVSQTERNNIFVVIHIIALLTTQSTAGVIYLLLIFLLIISKRLDGIGQSLIISIVIGAVFVLYTQFDVVLSELVAINPELFSKIQYQNMSFTDRTLNPIVDMMILLQHPLGCGIGQLTPLVREISSTMQSIVYSRTSTLTFFFAAFGIVGGLAYNATWIYGFLKNTYINNISKLILACLFIAVATSSPLNSNMTIWIMLFVFYKAANRKEPQLNESSRSI